MRHILGLGFAAAVVAVVAGCGGGASSGVPKGFRPETGAAFGTRDVWIVGQHDTLVRSTDGGARFTQVAFPPLPTQGNVPVIEFVSPRIGYAYGPGGDLYETRDGGTTWRGDGGVNAFASGGGFAYTISGGGRLERSATAGGSWKVIRSNVPSRGTSIAAHGSYVWLLGAPRRGQDSPTIAISSNRGRTFATRRGPCFFELPGRLVPAGGDVVWAVCPTGMMAGLWLSTNDGRSFASASYHDPGGTGLPPMTNGGEIFPTSPRSAILYGGADGPLYRTTDEGRRWERVRQPWKLTNEPDWIGFATARLGYALVATKLWRTTDGGESWHAVLIR